MNKLQELADKYYVEATTGKLPLSILSDCIENDVNPQEVMKLIFKRNIAEDNEVKKIFEMAQEWFIPLTQTSMTPPQHIALDAQCIKEGISRDTLIDCVGVIVEGRWGDLLITDHNRDTINTIAKQYYDKPHLHNRCIQLCNACKVPALSVAYVMEKLAQTKQAQEAPTSSTKIVIKVVK